MEEKEKEEREEPLNVCQQCGGQIIFTRSIVDGVYYYPVLEDGTVDMSVEAERFSGDIYEDFMCLNARKSLHDIPPAQLRQLRKRYDLELEVGMDAVKNYLEEIGAEMPETNKIDIFNYVKCLFYI